MNQIKGIRYKILEEILILVPGSALMNYYALLPRDERNGRERTCPILK